MLKLINNYAATAAKGIVALAKVILVAGIIVFFAALYGHSLLGFPSLNWTMFAMRIGMFMLYGGLVPLTIAVMITGIVSAPDEREGANGTA